MDPATITAAVAAAIKLVEVGQRIMEERRQSRELTPEQEAAWDREVGVKLAQSHWQPSTVKPA